VSKRFGSQHHGSGGFKDEWQSLVKDEFTANEQAVQIGVVDAAGIVIASTAMLHPNPPIDISDREHFRVHEQSQKDALFISQPVIGRASGKSSIQFTRPFWGADGKFAGVIVVSLDPSHLSRVYGNLNLGQDGGVALVGTDGIIRAGTGIYAGLLGANGVAWPRRNGCGSRRR